ncbi:MAG: alcohol dehydrogenase catalytic domain-containing protein [Anaerolineaceae bacterium]|nr:alcohol dehydrogenase catalytic domain-containing protein [Anaerolineaceae bacterium]
MTKTRTTIFTGPKQLEVKEVELPPLGERQVLVKIKACAICTWEQRFYKGSASEDYPFRGGHETSGEVVALGSGAKTDAKPGDGAALAIMNRCGSCDNCRRGMDNFCENDDGGKGIAGLPWGPGGLSDYIIVEDYQLYKVNAVHDYAALALAEPVACVLRSVHTPELEEGDTVLVQGVGMMGLLHVQLLQHRGVRVLVSEPDAARRKKALEEGAIAGYNPMEADGKQFVKDHTGGRGVKAVFFTAGGVPAVEAGIPLLAKRGWMCLYGSIHPKGMMAIDPNIIHYEELVITGSFSHTKASFRQAVALLAQGQVNTAPFISERVAFPNVDYAFERAISPDTYRVVMEF